MICSNFYAFFDKYPERETKGPKRKIASDTQESLNPSLDGKQIKDPWQVKIKYLGFLYWSKWIFSLITSLQFPWSLYSVILLMA